MPKHLLVGDHYACVLVAEKLKMSPQEFKKNQIISARNLYGYHQSDDVTLHLCYGWKNFLNKFEVARAKICGVKIVNEV